MRIKGTDIEVKADILRSAIVSYAAISVTGFMLIFLLKGSAWEAATFALILSAMLMALLLFHLAIDVFTGIVKTSWRPKQPRRSAAPEASIYRASSLAERFGVYAPEGIRDARQSSPSHEEYTAHRGHTSRRS